MTLNAKILEDFIDRALKKLTGDWVLIGGNVLYYMGAHVRPTMDIDLAGPPSSTQRDSLALMEIAESLNLPIESINQSGAFFLYRIPDWQKNLVLIAESDHCKFYRPNLRLLFQLKVNRLSQADRSDLLEAWRIEPDKDLLREDIRAICQDAEAKHTNEGRARLLTLIDALKKSPES